MFDADGSGVKMAWSWITPDAAWLVSDIHHAGHIKSSLQLFGNVTWWLFWENGYQALGVLDDDGDGVLHGRELDGLALWRDANGNGISEPGEVRTLAEYGITALSYRYEHDATHPDEIAWAPAGVTFANGTTRPTFDLIVHRR
jgi:hypothetical protein